MALNGKKKKKEKKKILPKDEVIVANIQVDGWKENLGGKRPVLKIFRKFESGLLVAAKR